MITVFYDGKCGLCSKEIAHYQKIAAPSIFIWQDITQCPQALNDHGVNLADALKYLHAKDKAGKLHIGVDAFILIWKNIKQWRVLAVFVGLPVIKQLAQICYRFFANWRFKKLTHCQIAAQQEKTP